MKSIFVLIIFALFTILIGLAPPVDNVNTDQSITVDAIDQNVSSELQLQTEMIMPVICRSEQIEAVQIIKLDENNFEQAFIPSNANETEGSVFQKNKHYARNSLKEWLTNYWHPLKYPLKV